jgi:hypothetical protein
MDSVHPGMNLIEKPGHLSTSEENIIGPFDQRKETGNLLNGICRRDRRHQGEERCLMGRDLRAENDGEIEV